MDHPNPANLPAAKSGSDLQQASRDYRFCEHATEVLIYVAALFSPWALGSVSNWAIRTMNWFEYALGLLLLYKWSIRWRTGYVPARWNHEIAGHSPPKREGRGEGKGRIP